MCGALSMDKNMLFACSFVKVFVMVNAILFMIFENLTFKDLCVPQIDFKNSSNTFN